MEVMAIGRISQSVQRVAGLVCSTEIVHVTNPCRCTEVEVVLYLEVGRNPGHATQIVVQVGLAISSTITQTASDHSVCVIY